MQVDFTLLLQCVQLRKGFARQASKAIGTGFAISVSGVTLTSPALQVASTPKASPKVEAMQKLGEVSALCMQVQELCDEAGYSQEFFEAHGYTSQFLSRDEK